MSSGVITHFPADIVHPVLLADARGEALRVTGEVEGTAFYLRRDVFMTAGRVLRTITASRKIALVGVPASFAPGHGATVAGIVDMEELPGDVGLLRIDVYLPHQPPPNELPWVLGKLDPLTHVATKGYPYEMHRVEQGTAVVSRSFAGHVVGTLYEFIPLGSSLAPFDVYEVSFAAPLGLSGAPLLAIVGRMPALAGIVIGHSKSSMLLHQSESIDHDSGVTVRSEHYGSLSLGVATCSTGVVHTYSRILRATLEGWLSDHGMIAGA